MYIPKSYGQSRIDNCPFCGKTGIIRNKQGIPVCHNHKDNNITEVKCACGKWLDLLQGKWGPYFHCENCGNMNFKRGIEMNPQVKPKQESSEKREITVTSDQLDTLFS
ncbi:hypothetical protein HY638_00365 [Candidatus Woesearchaeota archaeon]|nr:hypothetical protein [Candidatus Woesearchaeota archaeon]